MKHTNQQIAEVLDQAAYVASPTAQISTTQNLSLQQAYDIQRISIDRRLSRGEKLTGYKLGFTSKAKMEQMGVHSVIWGRLTDQMSYKDGEGLDLGNFIHPRVEPEIAFLVSKDIDKALDLEEIKNHVSHVAGALEIIDSRYENFKFSLEDVIADNCSSSGYKIGQWHNKDYRVSDLNIRMSINGELVAEGSSNAILGNPWESMVEISKMTEAYDFSIKAGEVVLAGAATSAKYLNSGDQVLGEFDVLGSLTLEVK